MHQMLAAHFAEAAPAVTTRRSDTPAGLATLVAQCLGKGSREPAAVGADLMQRLEDVTQPLRRRHRASHEPPASDHRQCSRRGRSPSSPTTDCSACGQRPATRCVCTNALAVLPFANVGGDLGAGILRRRHGRAVHRARQSARGSDHCALVGVQVQGTSRPRRARVGRALGAEYIVLRSVPPRGRQHSRGHRSRSLPTNKEVWRDLPRRRTQASSRSRQDDQSGHGGARPASRTAHRVSVPPSCRCQERVATKGRRTPKRTTTTCAHAFSS